MSVVAQCKIRVLDMVFGDKTGPIRSANLRAGAVDGRGTQGLLMNPNVANAEHCSNPSRKPNWVDDSDYSKCLANDGAVGIWFGTWTICI